MVAVLIPVSIPQGLDLWMYWVLFGMFSVILLIAILALIFGREKK